MNANTTKPERIREVRAILSGIEKHCSNRKTITLEGVVYGISELVKELETHLAILEESEAQKASWLRATAVERTKTAMMRPIYQSLRAYVGNQFGSKSMEFADFGFVPRKSGKKSVATKARAVEKQAATRAARSGAPRA